MSWDQIWDKIFESQIWGRYPPEELVRFIARNYYTVGKNRNENKILDAGCGTGSVTWFLAKEGFDTYGVDGSKTAINIAKERIKEENLDANLQVGDLTKLNYADNFFDSVVDIVAIQHNSIEDVKIILHEILRILKPGGKVFSMVINNRTKFSDPENNSFKQRGYFRLFSIEEIKDLFSIFDKFSFEIVERTDKGNFYSHYLIEAEKSAEI